MMPAQAEFLASHRRQRDVAQRTPAEHAFKCAGPKPVAEVAEAFKRITPPSGKLRGVVVTSRFEVGRLALRPGDGVLNSGLTATSGKW